MTQPDRSSFNALLGALAEVFAGEGRPGGHLAAAALSAAIRTPYRRTTSRADPHAVLKSACANRSAHPLAASVWACRERLDWTAWEGEGLASDVSANLYTTELVGPDGHCLAEAVRVGLLVSDADTDYPVSRHSGEETYFVISGVAEWTVGGSPYTAQAPGRFIHHPAWAPHGRRTRAEPFLGAWRWSGDLDLSSFSVDA